MVEYEGFITDIMIRIAGDIVLSDNLVRGGLGSGVNSSRCPRQS